MEQSNLLWWYTPTLASYALIRKSSGIELTASFKDPDRIIRELVQITEKDQCAVAVFKNGERHVLLPQKMVAAGTVTHINRFWLETEDSYDQKHPVIAKIYEDLENGKPKIFKTGETTKLYGHAYGNAKTISRYVSSIVPIDGGFIVSDTSGHCYLVKEREPQFEIDVDMKNINQKVIPFKKKTEPIKKAVGQTVQKTDYLPF